MEEKTNRLANRYWRTIMANCLCGGGDDIGLSCVCGGVVASCMQSYVVDDAEIERQEDKYNARCAMEEMQYEREMRYWNI